MLTALAALPLAALPIRDVVGAGCLDRAERERGLVARLPEDAPPVALRIRRSDDGSAVLVELHGAGEAPVTRALPGGTGDCAELPRAIAQVVERRLRALADAVPSRVL